MAMSCESNSVVIEAQDLSEIIVKMIVIPLLKNSEDICTM